MPESPREGLEFQRPQGWRFAFEGVNLRDVPDALPYTKFASAKNIRATATQSVQTRPGYTLEFVTGGNPVTDLRAYATLETDDLPRTLARDSLNGIYLDNGALLTTLAGNNGSGVAMAPFRPSQSPQAWMYVAGLGDYQKISAPDASDVVTAQKVGIAEPLDSCQAAPRAPGFTPMDNAFGISGLIAGGTAGAPANGTRTTDTAGAVVPDQAGNILISVQVGSTVGYGIGEIVQIGADYHVVQDVLAPVSLGTVSAIRYRFGTSGECTIVPTQAAVGPNTVAGTEFIGGLRRGSLIQVGTEVALVLGVASGPDGSLCFDTSTVGTHTAGETLTGIPAITVALPLPVLGQTIMASMITSSVTVGIGTLSKTLLTSPFVGWNFPGLNLDDQYVHISCLVDDITKLNEIRVIFNVDSEAVPSYTKNYYYYAIQPSLFAQAIANNETQVQALLGELVQSTVDVPLPDQSVDGSSQWTELYIPVSSFTRVGGDDTRSLANCNGVQLVINASATVAFSLSSLYVSGRAQPDVGDEGAPYRYRAVPRSTLTGVQGNPTPPMRYGVRPRLQPVPVGFPDIVAGEPFDVWDIYRYGGTVTSYRYIGSLPAANNILFEDVYNDQAALAGSELQTDNFEPWPSVDVPFTVAVGGGVTVSTFGTWIVVDAPTWPATVLRWLPGTLVQLGAQSAYSLRSRPQQLSATSYLFETEECIGPQVTPEYFWVLEPQVARQFIPYVFGPDVEGTFFGVGDPLRPGTVSFTKQNAPDSAPAKYTIELCPPSDPLLGGIIKGGVSLVASTKRWWALYPAFTTAQRYSPIEQSVGRGLVSGYGHITDGNLVYFWTRDGIAITDGGPYKSLTDADLYNLFPHEGVAGVDVTRNGVTYFAPDYSRAAEFRLGKINQYLYADYPGQSDGLPHSMVCDLRTGGWVTDIYADQIDIHYGGEQQSGPLVGGTGQYPQGLLADKAGKVWRQVDCAGDNSVKIDVLVAPFEWDGGDLRAQPLFGDAYLDCVPQSPVTVTPTSQGNNIGAATVIPATGNRTFSPISIQGGELQKFCGLVITWSD